MRNYFFPLQVPSMVCMLIFMVLFLLLHIYIENIYFLKNTSWGYQLSITHKHAQRDQRKLTAKARVPHEIHRHHPLKCLCWPHNEADCFLLPSGVVGIHGSVHANGIPTPLSRHPVNTPFIAHDNNSRGLFGTSLSPCYTKASFFQAEICPSSFKNHFQKPSLQSFLSLHSSRSLSPSPSSSNVQNKLF